MDKYPQLEAMGIQNPEQIEKYMVNGISDYDVLRVIYERQSGSLLPLSRTYKFKRVQRDVPLNPKKTKTSAVLETDPELKQAISELKDLLSEKSQKGDVREELLEQIRPLEEDIALRAKYIRKLSKRL